MSQGSAPASVPVVQQLRGIKLLASSAQAPSPGDSSQKQASHHPSAPARMAHVGIAVGRLRMSSDAPTCVNTVGNKTNKEGALANTQGPSPGDSSQKQASNHPSALTRTAPVGTAVGRLWMSSDAPTCVNTVGNKSNKEDTPANTQAPSPGDSSQKQASHHPSAPARTAHVGIAVGRLRMSDLSLMSTPAHNGSLSSNQTQCSNQGNAQRLFAARPKLSSLSGTASGNPTVLVSGSQSTQVSTCDDDDARSVADSDFLSCVDEESGLHISSDNISCLKDLDALRTQFAQLQGDMHSRMSVLSEDHAVLKTRVVAGQSDYKALKAEFDRYKASTSSRIDSVEAENESLRSRVDSLLSQHDALKTAFEQYRADEQARFAHFQSQCDTEVLDLDTQYANHPARPVSPECRKGSVILPNCPARTRGMISTARLLSKYMRRCDSRYCTLEDFEWTVSELESSIQDLTRQGMKWFGRLQAKYDQLGCVFDHELRELGAGFENAQTLFHDLAPRVVFIEEVFREAQNSEHGEMEEGEGHDDESSDSSGGWEECDGSTPEEGGQDEQDVEEDRRSVTSVEPPADALVVDATEQGQKPVEGDKQLVMMFQDMSIICTDFEQITFRSGKYVVESEWSVYDVLRYMSQNADLESDRHECNLMAFDLLMTTIGVIKEFTDEELDPESEVIQEMVRKIDFQECGFDYAQYQLCFDKVLFVPDARVIRAGLSPAEIIRDFERSENILVNARTAAGKMYLAGFFVTRLMSSGFDVVSSIKQKFSVVK